MLCSVKRLAPFTLMGEIDSANMFVTKKRLQSSLYYAWLPHAMPFDLCNFFSQSEFAVALCDITSYSASIAWTKSEGAVWC